MKTSNLKAYLVCPIGLSTLNFYFEECFLTEKDNPSQNAVRKQGKISADASFLMHCKISCFINCCVNGLHKA